MIGNIIRRKIREWLRRGPRIVLVQGDITRQRVDAIVNAAKSSLMGGGGVDGAIHAAGGPTIGYHCANIRQTRYPQGLPVGYAVRTPGGLLRATHVIHTVGPRYDIREDRSALLRSCYEASLNLADRHDCETIAFPIISSGVYGWPMEDAVRQALTAIRATPTRVREVRLVVFDEMAYRIADRVMKG